MALIAGDETLVMRCNSHLNGHPTDVRDLPVAPMEKTKEYWLDCDGKLNASWKEKLNEDAYLRVTLNAVGQAPYCVDLVADWQKAWNRAQEPFTVKRTGRC